jgi:hypothetical protein
MAKQAERFMTGFLTPTQVACALSLSGQRVHQLMATGKLACVMTPLRRLIEVREVERLKREREAKKAVAA